MDKNEVLNYFFELVKIDSPSGDERKLADKLKKDLKDLGFKVEEDDSGQKAEGNAGNIIAYLKGNARKPPVLFAAHMDTVEKRGGILPVIDEEGKIFSEGPTVLTADDKAGICAIVQGIKWALKKGVEHGDIEIVFTVCEEIGLKGSKNLDTKKLKSKVGFVLDSSGKVGTIVTAAPAQNKLYFKIKGRAAHAGLEPEKGLSAIKVAGVAISNMNFGRIDEETTANIGIIRGGKATNIITDLVEMEGEARSRNELKLKRQTEHMIQAVKDAADSFGAEVECEVEASYPAFDFDECALIVRYVMNAVEKIGLKPILSPSGGGSDANILNGKGIPCVNLGTGFFNPHSPEEYITIESLINLCKLVEALL